MGILKKTTQKMDANTLEATLKNQQWVGGQAPTAADKDAFEAMKSASPSAETHPNVFAWFCLSGNSLKPSETHGQLLVVPPREEIKERKVEREERWKQRKKTIWMISSVATMMMMA